MREERNTNLSQISSTKLSNFINKKKESRVTQLFSPNQTINYLNRTINLLEKPTTIILDEQKIALSVLYRDPWISQHWLIAQDAFSPCKEICTIPLLRSMSISSKSRWEIEGMREATIHYLVCVIHLHRWLYYLRTTSLTFMQATR